MKLHLPKGLRKALLACLASLSVTLPSTLGSVSGIAVISILASARAHLQAADIPDYGTAEPCQTTQDVSGNKWLKGVTKDHTINVKAGTNLKLSTTGENGPTLNLDGAINSLYFTSDEMNTSGNSGKGTFMFGSEKWNMNSGASVADIYVDNAELWFDDVDTDLGNANVHLKGQTDVNSYSGALRGRNSATITIGGSLDVMGDTLISLQSNSNVIVNGELTGTGDLLIGAYRDIGNGAVKLRAGGTLAGQLVFWGENGISSRLVLGAPTASQALAAAEGGVTLTVEGLSSKTETEGEGGVILADGEATLVLNGGETYTYRGTIDTATASGADGGGTPSYLNLTVQLGDGGKQVLSGDAHLKNLTVSGGTLEVTGNLTLNVGGTSDKLVVNGANASLAVSGSIFVTSPGGSDDGAVKVVGGSTLTAASLSGNSNNNDAYFKHGHAPALTVGEGEGSVGKVVIGDEKTQEALLQVKHLTVAGTESSVTVWGDLSSSYGDSSTITGGTVKVSGGMVQKGTLTVNGGTLTVGGYYANASNATTENGGAIALSNGGSMAVGGGLHSAAVELTGVDGKQSKLTLSSEAQTATENTVGTMTLGEHSMVELGVNQTLTVDTLALNATAGNAQLKLTMTPDGNNLNVTHLTLGENGKLSIILDGAADWMGQHTEKDAKYQLFNEGNFTALWSEFLQTTPGESPNDIFEFMDEEGSNLRCTLSDNGALLFSASIIWNGGEDGVWNADDSSGHWEDGTHPDAESYVAFTDDVPERMRRVQLDGNVAVNGVDVISGTYTFTNSEKGGSLAANDLTVKENATLNLQTTLKEGTEGGMRVILQGKLDVQDGANLEGNVKVQFNGGTLLYTASSATTDIVSDSVDADRSTGMAKVDVADGVSGKWGNEGTSVGTNGGLKLALDGNKDGQGIVKSGAGEFTLAWRGDAQEHGGALTVNEGTLKLEVSGGTSKLTGNITGAGRLTISGGSVTLSGTNTVKEIELGTGSTTTISGTESLGWTETTLILSGGKLAGVGGGATASAGTVKAEEAATVGNVTLTGKVTGDANLTAEKGSTAGLSGDITEYKGMLNTEASGTWKLSGGATEGAVGVSVGGKGTVQFDGVATYGGKVDGNVTLDGLVGLTIVSGDTSTGAKLKGTVTLGTAGKQARWNGSEVLGGTITLANVTLAEKGFGAKESDAKIYVKTSEASAPQGAALYAAGRLPVGGTVDVNGMEAGKLDGITINAYGQLTGLTGEYKAATDRELSLQFSAANVDTSAAPTEGKKALIVGQNEEFTLDASSNASLDITYAEADIFTLLKETETDEASGTVYLHLLQGGSLLLVDNFSIDSLVSSGMLSDLVDEFKLGQDKENSGNIVMTGRVGDVFVVPEHVQTTIDAAMLQDMKATVFATGRSATFATDSKATIPNLLGGLGSAMTLRKSENATSGRVTFSLRNSLEKDIAESEPPYPEFGGTTVHGQNTTFLGSIIADKGVDIDKTGMGTLTVGDAYTLADGTTTLREGALALQGKDNNMENLAFAYTTKQDAEQELQRGLVLDGGTTTINGSMSDTENTEDGNEVHLRNGAKLVLKGASDLKDTDIVGETGGGTIVLEGTDEKGAELSLGSGVLSGVAVQLNGKEGKEGEKPTNPVLDIGSGISSVTTLSGNGVLKSKDEAELSVSRDSTFSGTLSSNESDGAAGSLVVKKGANFTLDNVKTTAENPSQGWGIKLEEGAGLTIDLSEMGAKEHLTLGNVDLGTGNTTTIQLNTDTYNASGDGSDTIWGNALTFGDNSTIVLEAVEGRDWDTYRELTLGRFSDIQKDPAELNIQLKGDAFLMLEVKEVIVERDGSVRLVLDETEENPFLQAIPHGEKNAKAGAVMAWESLRHKIDASSRYDVLTADPTSDYARAMHALLNMADSNAPGMERSLTAVAGASISTLGPAVTEDVHRQLNAIRNRMTTMANEVTEETYDKLPLWHAWINAEGNYHKLDADSLAPGYTLNSWGGTVGVDADVSPHITVGLAISAMYGDLKTDAADSATGSVDTMYLSAFLRAAKGSWVHSFVVTCGIAEVDLDRTVNYGSGSYSTNGSTDGYTFGAMYEVGYTGFVNKRGTAALQPVANVEVRHISLKGYSETGSDAGLTVDDMERTVLTFGVGARAQVAVGANAFNRTSVLESRALLKFDVGDRSGTARNAIIGDSTYAETESAEVGAVGVEVGVGISVPLGAQSGSVFADGSLEFRDGWTSANATLGYRVTF